MTYDPSGRRTELSYPNGVTTTYSYSPSSYLTSLSAQKLQEPMVNSFSYVHDGMGSRTSITDLSGVHNYVYDHIYQLIQATHPNMPTEKFSYDSVRNRISAEGEAVGTPLARTYTYDWENRLTKIEYSGILAQYKYDPLGRRIEKNVNGDITRYVYDGPNVVTEYDGNGNVKNAYIHNLGVDDPLAVEQGGQVYFYHKDGLGSVTELSDASGTPVKTYGYKSFGEIYSETGTIDQPYTFTGREYDSESGLYYYRARYYDPKAGRFLTKDPIGFAGGDVNLYRYVGNKPINFVDPWGLFRYAPGAGQPVEERTAEALMCFENCIGREIIVTGARETGLPHVPGSAHETGQACDIGKSSNPSLNRFDVEGCFNHCSDRYGFVWGYEGIGHFHFQTRSGVGGATGFAPGIR